MRRLLTFAFLLTTAVHGQSISPNAIGAHMNFLASDLLEGRATGTRGYDIAAQYVATQFQLAGLEPGGDGSWFQRVPFLRVLPAEGTAMTVTRNGESRRSFAFGEGFITHGSPTGERAIAEGGVVFVGYGITAPTLQHDDYAGLDVRGKIVVYLTNAPASFPNDLRAHYSSSLVKLKNAAAHGAVATLTLRPPLDERRVAWARMVRQTKLGSMNWIEADGSAHDWPEGMIVSGTLHRTAAEALFGASLPDIWKAMDERRVKGFSLPAQIRIEAVSRHDRLESANVVGVLRGSDPLLRSESIVYSSHLDHLGITDPVDGDSINNGAFDNASGIAAMIEIARAFARGNRPKRSIVFLATTAEEKGLRGADYFANRPTAAAGTVVANINIDQILMVTPVRDVIVIGGEHTSLGDAATRVASRMNVTISPDPRPEEVVFVRSDQYPFVKRGIPAIYVTAGYKSSDPKIDALKLIDEWDEKIYHSPHDEMDQPMALTVGAMVAQFDYLLGLDVANRRERPAWKEGDFFGDMFATSSRSSRSDKSTQSVR